MTWVYHLRHDLARVYSFLIEEIKLCRPLHQSDLHIWIICYVSIAF
ncbi:hypothetical protein ACFPFV_12430 [Salinicoccus siamensis]